MKGNYKSITVNSVADYRPPTFVCMICNEYDDPKAEKEETE